LRRPRDEKPYILGQKVKRALAASGGTYGTRRIKAALGKEGTTSSRPTIARIMKQFGLVAKAKRKTRMTTNSNHKLPVAPNLLNQDFAVMELNQVWVTDISYFQTTQGWMYRWSTRSAWQDAAIITSGTREVNSRTVFCYRVKQ